MQFLECIFRSQSLRRYTYRNTGDPVRVGDLVLVTTPAGTLRTVEVVSISDRPPVGLPAHVTLKDIQGLSDELPDN